MISASRVLRAWGENGMRIRVLKNWVLGVEPNPAAPEHGQVLPRQVYPQKWLRAAGDPISRFWTFLEKQWLSWSSCICLCLEIRMYWLTFPQRQRESCLFSQPNLPFNPESSDWVFSSALQDSAAEDHLPHIWRKNKKIIVSHLSLLISSRRRCN